MSVDSSARILHTIFVCRLLGVRDKHSGIFPFRGLVSLDRS